jgi:hypothetical protein
MKLAKRIGMKKAKVEIALAAELYQSCGGS